MIEIKINEQISFLRKQKNITQEELAQAIWVTNQSVSKWESGSCCPDIQLLPVLAKFFNVSIDELMGYKSSESFENVYLKIKTLFQMSPENESFSIAFKLSTLLHEGAVTSGYKKYVPWDTNKNRSIMEDCYKWGFSACSEPEGTTVHRANSIFISDTRIAQPVSPTEIRDIYSFLENIFSIDTLKVFFGIYELTKRDFDYYVSIEDIKTKCKLSIETIYFALDKLPIQIKDTENGETLYRIEGCYMHISPILLLLK